MTIKITINGTSHSVEVDDDTPLLWILRDRLGLTGTKFGCGVGVCGACTVLENDTAVRACQVPGSEAEGRSFVTIEGLSADGNHPCQKAWIEEDVAQCGYCQPGMIMTACALLKKNAQPGDEEIDDAMSESVCRCGTYPRMRKAIRRAGEMMVKSTACLSHPESNGSTERSSVPITQAKSAGWKITAAASQP